MLRSYLKSSIPLSLFFLETFSHYEIIKEFLIYCPIPDLRRFVVGLLYSAMCTVYSCEEPKIREYLKLTEKGFDKLGLKIVKTGTSDTPPLMISQFERHEVAIETNQDFKNIPYLVIFMNNLIHMTFSLDAFKSNFMLCQFHQIYQYFTELGDTARIFMIQNQMISRLFDCFKWQIPNSLPPFSESRNLKDVLFFRFTKHFYVGLSDDTTQITMIAKKIILET